MARTISEKQLEKYIMSPPKGSIEIQIRPDLADFALAQTNHRNRPISALKVSKYADDMEKDNWSITGDSIKFGNDGLLKDGQHRLVACTQAKTPFVTHAVFGIDPDTFQHIDIGKKRDGSDTLAMMNVPNYKTATAIIRMIISYEVGYADSPKNGVSNDWLKHKYLEEIDHDLLQEAVVLAKRVYKTTKWQTGLIGAFFYMAVKKGQRDQITKFFDDMCKGIGDKPRSPIPFLLENVNRMRIDRAYHLRAFQYSIMLSRAYANYKAGKASTKADVTVSLKDEMVDF
jgi:hypothetical protein|tara:strand:- start:16928 stop:17785 length:858 start_codon:yes stop_codon:yes gene_type:complete